MELSVTIFIVTNDLLSFTPPVYLSLRLLHAGLSPPVYHSFTLAVAYSHSNSALDHPPPFSLSFALFRALSLAPPPLHGSPLSTLLHPFHIPSLSVISDSSVKRSEPSRFPDINHSPFSLFHRFLDPVISLPIHPLASTVGVCGEGLARGTSAVLATNYTAILGRIAANLIRK